MIMNHPWSTHGLLLVGFATIFAGVFGFGIWAAYTEIDGAVVATGFVEVESRRQLVQHPDGGRIAEIFVWSGEVVDAGAPIIRLDDLELRAQETLYAQELLAVQARLDRLASEFVDEVEPHFRDELLSTAAVDETLMGLLEVERAIFATRKDGLRQVDAQFAERVEQAEISIAGRERQLSALRRQEEILIENLRTQESLSEQGLVEAPRVRAIQLELADLDGEIGALESSIAETRSAIAGYKIERRRAANDWLETAQEEFRALQPREGEYTERLHLTRAEIERLTLRAPMAGIVDDMQFFTVGGVLPPGASIATIIPISAGLFIHIRIDPIQIDRIYSGQEAVVRFPNFNSRTTPEFKGLLRRVSANALVDPQTQLRYFDAEVELTESLPEGISLIPGMPAEVFFQSEPRTPLSFLIKPLSDYLGHALREE